MHIVYSKGVNLEGEVFRYTSATRGEEWSACYMAEHGRLVLVLREDGAEWYVRVE